MLLGDVLEVAPALLGGRLLVDGVGGRIVEVEAYREDDPASHSYGGPRGRNLTMFGPAGRLYVYRSYGIHWCANIVCGEDGVGSAVLVRALEPSAGIEQMRERRRVAHDRLLCAGPGRLSAALGISGADDGALLDGNRLSLELPQRPVAVIRTRRVGISRGVELPWRFLEEGSLFVSRPRCR
jgi:DNA-3-methyladenine glycosylase